MWLIGTRELARFERGRQDDEAGSASTYFLVDFPIHRSIPNELASYFESSVQLSTDKFKSTQKHEGTYMADCGVSGVCFSRYKAERYGTSSR